VDAKIQKLGYNIEPAFDNVSRAFKWIYKLITNSSSLLDCFHGSNLKQIKLESEKSEQYIPVLNFVQLLKNLCIKFFKMVILKNRRETGLS